MENQLFYPNIRWNVSSKFLLRFTFVLFVLLSVIPFVQFLDAELIPWIGAHVMHLEKPIDILPNGSGDTTFNYVELLFFVFCSLVVGTIWLFFNKQEKTNDRILHYMLIFFRYFLASALISYGYAKIFYNQFGEPGLSTLLQPYGESSPMGIAWTFIGASKAYTMFSGIAEFIGGILLLFRRTSAIGALIGFAVMINVMMMNYCYDIPVKLYSTQLVIMAFVILYFKGYNLKHVLITHKAVDAPTFRPLFTQKWLRVFRLVLKGSFILYFVVFDCYEQYATVEIMGPDAPKAPLYGIYKPTQLIKNSDTLRLYSDSAEWKQLVIEYPGWAMYQQLNDRKHQMCFEVDTLSRFIITYDYNDTLNKSTLNYALLNDTTMQLSGIYKKDTINYTFGKVNLKSFTLINRGFHWINEYPYNR